MSKPTHTHTQKKRARLILLANAVNRKWHIQFGFGISHSPHVLHNSVENDMLICTGECAASRAVRMPFHRYLTGWRRWNTKLLSIRTAAYTQWSQFWRLSLSAAIGWVASDRNNSVRNHSADSSTTNFRSGCCGSCDPYVVRASLDDLMIYWPWFGNFSATERQTVRASNHPQTHWPIHQQSHKHRPIYGAHTQHTDNFSFGATDEWRWKIIHNFICFPFGSWFV